MTHYTIRVFSENTLLESLTTKLAVNNLSNKAIKLLMSQFDADEAEVYESDYAGRMSGDPIKTIKLKK